MVALFKSLKISGRENWKSVQVGVIMATTSVLDIQEELLGSGHKFLLTSHLTQDCLENLFRVVRLNNPVPSPVAFKCALKIISIAQFMKPLGGNRGSYQDDDCGLLCP